MHQDYTAAWKDLKHRKHAVVWLVITACAFLLVTLVIGHATSFNLESVFVLWVIASPVVMWRWAMWPCPRCGKLFRGHGPFWFVYPDRCRFCGLSYGASSEG